MKDFFTEADAMFPCMDEHKAEHGYRSYVSMVKVITLEKANRLLRERGRVVYSDDMGKFYWCENDHGACTKHVALLINIEQIKSPDSAESLLKELSRAHNQVYLDKGERVAVYGKILDRVEKFLEQK